MSPLPDVIVVGGGAIGCAAAWTLAREGVRVRLLERDSVASGASGAAAGMLAPVGEAAGDPDSPILRWGLRSLAAFPELCRELGEASGVDPELERSGLLRVASSASSAEAMRTAARALGAERESGPGLELEWLDASAVRAFEPRLAEGIAGALWSPHESHVRSPLLVRAFAGAARACGARIECGVEVRGWLCEGRRVVGVETGAGALGAAHVVLCAGAWSRELDACAGGLAPPVSPVRGQICSLDAPWPASRAIVWDERVYLVAKRDGSLVVGATEEEAGFDCRVTAGGLARLLDGAQRLVPALAEARFREGWAGLRPATPDRLPLVGPAPGCEGLTLATGHFRNGVLLSPVTGRLVADCVLGKGLPPDAAAFDPARLDRGAGARPAPGSA